MSNDTHLTTTERIELRKRLLELRAELMQFISEGEAARQPVDLEQPIGRVSRGDALQQQQMALANTRGAQERLLQVEAALKRFETEEFGICSECGDFIRYSRLVALPETRRCIDCAR